MHLQLDEFVDFDVTDSSGRSHHVNDMNQTWQFFILREFFELVKRFDDIS